MQTHEVPALAEATGSMTFPEGLAFIARTRCQLAHFHELPHGPGQTIAQQDDAKIRGMCGDLQADLDRSLLGIYRSQDGLGRGTVCGTRGGTASGVFPLSPVAVWPATESVGLNASCALLWPYCFCKWASGLPALSRTA